MIATLAEIKTILGITDTTYDAVITAILPGVENDLLEWLNNKFLFDSVSYGASLTPTASNTFVGTSGGINSIGFANGDIIYVEGSNRNDGFFTLASFTDTNFTVSETVVTETAKTLTVTLVKFPSQLKVAIARMVGSRVLNGNRSMVGGVRSESLADYSVTLNLSSSSAGYSDDILGEVSTLRIPRFA